MSRTERTHPVEILIVAALLTAEAAITLLVALVALVATVLGPKPVAPRPQLPAPTPIVHPLFTVATDIQALTCKELAKLVGTRKRLNKSQLVGMLVAVGV